jgi:hypothetical protein
VTGVSAAARYPDGVAYRDDGRVIEAARAEEREIATMTRDARMRRVRVASILAVAGALLVGGTALAARVPAKAAPTYHCHRVTVVFEQQPGPPSPPPQSWTTCEWR